MADSRRFGDPRKECDLVMKGGVASGIVYPQAILTLAEKYRLRSVGGTSAGAIAAALAVAAEYGRESGGFERLDAIRAGLLRRGAIKELFQPTARTKPLWETIWGFVGMQARPKSDDILGMERAARRVVAETVAPRYRNGGLLGGLIGLALGAGFGLLLALCVAALWQGIAALTGAPGAFPTLFVVLAIILGNVIGVLGAVFGWRVGGLVNSGIALAKIAMVDVREQDFGICTGSTDRHDNPTALVDWLHARINECAGLDVNGPPLTFRDLHKKRLTNPDKDVSISLRAVTTNLTQGRPYIFPLDDTLFVFRAVEMRARFPLAVCVYMEQNADDIPGLELPPGYHFLPRGDALPVIVATRLSLSLPIVLSAIHLYTITDDAMSRAQGHTDRGTPLQLHIGDLQENWFTDGGISSNFPIQLFDSWLPTRPTFGIRLTGRPEKGNKNATERIDRKHLSVRPETLGAVARGDAAVPNRADSDPTDPVYLPPARAEISPDWTPVTTLPGFGIALFNAARNYHDNMQSALASYRERIAQVRLGPEEGGLNLDMPEPVLMRMNGLGETAAERFIEFYGLRNDPDRPDTRFQEHRWVRLRVLMTQLEEQFDRVGTSYANQIRATDPDWNAGTHADASQLFETIRRAYRELIDAQADASATDQPWYADEGRAWCAAALERLDALFALMERWRVAELPECPPHWPPFFADPSTPKPSGTLRVAPEL